MAAAAPSPLASSVEKTNGAKLSSLLIDGGTTVLRNVFDGYHPPANLAAGLNANYSTLNSLRRRRVLSKPQWDLLFPPGTATPDSKTFDINLLFLLLTNICGLSPPLSGWRTPPPSSDTSLEANLTRIKLYHNQLYSRRTSTGIQTAVFNIKWLEISAVLVALGLDQVEIDRLKAERWGREDYHVQHDFDDSLEDIKTRPKNTDKYSATTEQNMEEVGQTRLELHEIPQNSKLEEFNNIQTKIRETVEEVRQTQLDDSETLHDSNSKLDEVLDNSLVKLAEQLSSDDDDDDDDSDDEDKIQIHRETIANEGTHWHLKEWGVHMAFPCDAISEPTVIEVRKWKNTACSPQLHEHEAVVSNVIEISTSSDEALEFKAEVKLTLSHSAADLHGYELLVFKLTNKETNEWEDVGGTEDFRNLSDIEEENLSAKDAPDFHFPIVQAQITECSTYAVVCRLKSSVPYSITSNGGSFSLPEYPNVCVTIPKKAVAPKVKIPLELKVHEVPHEEFKGKEIVVGPILRISCSEVVEFWKPVTIQLPVSLGDEKQDIPDVSKCRVRVLFLRTEEERKEWVEITDKLKNSLNFDGKTIKFQVQRLSGYACLLDWRIKYFSVAEVIGHLSSLIWYPLQLAVFFAYFPPSKRPNSQDILFLICCPSHLRDQVLADLERRNIILPSEADSVKKMKPGHDKAYISLSGGIRAVNENDAENVHLRFEGLQRHKGQVRVRVISDKVSVVKFYSSSKLKEEDLLCILNLSPRSLKRDVMGSSMESSGVSVSDHVFLNSQGDPEHANESSVKRRTEPACTSPKRPKLMLEHLPGHAVKRKRKSLGSSTNRPLATRSAVKRKRESPGSSSKRPKLTLKDGTPENDDLEELALEIVEEWEKLGRRLFNNENNEGELYAIDRENEKLSEKAYKMLIKWKAAKGSDATFGVLHDALCHRLVNRRDLAEKYCLVNDDI